MQDTISGLFNENECIISNNIFEFNPEYADENCKISEVARNFMQGTDKVSSLNSLGELETNNFEKFSFACYAILHNINFLRDKNLDNIFQLPHGIFKINTGPKSFELGAFSPSTLPRGLIISALRAEIEYEINSSLSLFRQMYSTDGPATGQDLRYSEGEKLFEEKQAGGGWAPIETKDVFSHPATLGCYSMERK